MICLHEPKLRLTFLHERLYGSDIKSVNSRHVETVVLLSKLRHKPDDYIDVDVDVAELEGTSAETKATYEKNE